MRLVLTPLCRYTPDPGFFQRALALASSASLSWYDSLIVQAAQDLGCTVLHSEDLQHGQIFGKLRIENPFRG